MAEPQRPGWAFECEDQPPEHMCSGFKMVGGNVSVFCAYAVYPLGVLLIVHTKIGDSPAQLWRRIWAPRDEAVDAAEALVMDAEEYLQVTLNCRVREVEDADLSDWLEHLDTCLKGRFH